jgi:NAD(P)-dependent dehydrogenase (short-subunit alcohol dehydrogenase family)
LDADLIHKGRITVPAAAKCAIVTGAASGLGRAIAVRLAYDGWRIALVDIDDEGCRRTLDEVNSAGGAGQVELTDVSSPTAWEELRDRLQAQWPQLDLLVNNAGVCGAGEVGEFSLDDWQWLLATNLLGVVYGCHTMVDWLKANPNGAQLLNVASIAAFAAAPSMAAYSVAKAGVVALSEALRAELSSQGVSVSVLCPGFVPTGLLGRGRFSRDAHRRAAERLTRISPLTAEGIADAAIRALARRRFYVIEGLRSRLLWRLKRWFPRLFLWLMALVYRRELADQRGDATPLVTDLVRR